jgi:hypothetical protein
MQKVVRMSGSGWVEVLQIKGATLETLGKSRRFVGLAWYEPLSAGTSIVIVDTVKQMGAAGWRGISIEKWFHGVA